MKFYFYFCLFLAIIPVILSSQESKESAVIVLNDKNFNKEINKGDWFLKFYAPWCGHCKRLAPTYIEAAESVKGEINFGEIDATKERKLSAKFGVNSYPTLFFYHEGKYYHYNGLRTAKDIVEFAKEGYKTAEVASGVGNDIGWRAEIELYLLDLSDFLEAGLDKVANFLNVSTPVAFVICLAILVVTSIVTFVILFIYCLPLPEGDESQISTGVTTKKTENKDVSHDKAD